MLLIASCSALLTLALSQGSLAPRLPSGAPPSVVLVVLDDVSLFDLDGLPLPALDSLARRGLRFERAYGMPICYPARRALLSGEVWTQRRSANPCDPGPVPGPQVGDLPLPELCRLAGLRTAGFGKWHLGTDPLGRPWQLAPHAHGFEHWKAGVPANVELCGGRNYRRWTRLEEGRSHFETAYQTGAVVDSFVSWWNTVRGPRFAYVAFQAAHEPFHRPPDAWLPPGYPPTPGTRAQYEAMLVSLDVALDLVLAEIDLERTYVIVVGDNGTPEPVAPDPLKAKQTTFERGIRVPMVMAGPGIAPGVTSAPVHQVDVFATLQELLGLAPGLRSRDGVSFLPCLRNPAARPRSHVFVQLQDDLAVVSERFKLREKAGLQSFYDLTADPLEESPLPLDDPLWRRELEQHRAWLEASRR